MRLKEKEGVDIDPLYTLNVRINLTIYHNSHTHTHSHENKYLTCYFFDRRVYFFTVKYGIK